MYLLQPSRRKFISIRYLFLLLCLCSVSVWALSTDKDQDILIEADSAEIDDLNGITVYRGNVITRQGSIDMRGDTMQVFFDELGEFDKLILFGIPAVYRQLPDASKLYDEAEAQQMEYYKKKGHIILIDQAKVRQPHDGVTYQGKRIEYDTEKSKVWIKSDVDKVAVPEQPAVSNQLPPRIKFTIKNKRLRSDKKDKPTDEPVAN